VVVYLDDERPIGKSTTVTSNDRRANENSSPAAQEMRLGNPKRSKTERTPTGSVA
jgi:hypothetical protein